METEIEKILVVWSKATKNWALKLVFHNGDFAYDYMEHGGLHNLILKARDKYGYEIDAGAVLHIEAAPEYLGIFAR